MQTITTKYLGPTDTKGSRISAKASGAGAGGRVTMPVDQGHDLPDNHAAAAIRVMERMDWHGRMIGGHAERGMVWVFEGDDYTINR